MFLLCINILILSGVSFFLFKKFSKGNDKIIFSIAFSVRILAGISFAYAFLFYYGDGDTFLYFKEAYRLALLAKTDFGLFIKQLLSGERFFTTVEWLPTFSGGAFNFVKLLSFLHLLTGGNYWLCTLYISVFAFYCAWKLFISLSGFDKRLRYPALIAFHFIPMVLFFNSGLIKSSLIISVLFLCVSFALEIIKFNRSKGMTLSIILFFFFSVFLYFLDEVLFQVSFALLNPFILLCFLEKGIKVFKNYFWLRWGVFCALFFLIFFGTLSFVSLKDLFTEAVYTPIAADLNQNYYNGNSFDIGEHSVLTPGKILLAVFTGLFRPFQFSENFMLTISAIENVVLLNLFLFSIVWLVFRFIRQNKNSGSIAITATCFFILWLAFYYGFSTANFGALVRKKTIYEPFLFFLLLIPLFRIADLRKKSVSSVI